MSAKYTKIKGTLIKEDSITTQNIKDSTILQNDIALGSITDNVFQDYSIRDIKLSNTVTKQGNDFNLPNKLVQLNSNGKIPNNLIDFSSLSFENISTINLSDVEGNVNSPFGLLKLNASGKIDNFLIDVNSLLYKQIDSSFLSDSDLIVKYDANNSIDSNFLNIKRTTNEPEIKPNYVALFFDDATQRLLVKTQNGVQEIAQNIFFVSSEIPQGQIDGINTEFVLQYIPISNSERVYINGIREKKVNYTVINKTIIFSEPPFTGAEIIVDYSYIGG